MMRSRPPPPDPPPNGRRQRGASASRWATPVLFQSSSRFVLCQLLDDLREHLHRRRSLSLLRLLLLLRLCFQSARSCGTVWSRSFCCFTMGSRSGSNPSV